MSDSRELKIDEENDLYYFESDHLALRGNKEYSELLKTITILEAQRVAALHDIDKIIEIQNEALKDPSAFIEKFKNNEDINIPIPQNVAEVPQINFSKYGVRISQDVLKSLNEEKSEIIHTPIKEMRKPKTKEVSATYNQPWSAEEQKRLEELLIKYPVEAIEMRRYKKIADDLGNRTVKQVTSRVQKYFKKLYKAGLPVPGRIPKTADRKKAYSHRHQRNNYYLYKPSTFFPDMDIPVVMNEADDEDNQITPIEILDKRKSDKNPIDKLELKETDELQLKIVLLKQIKHEKFREKKTAEYAHEGYKCDICNEEPIMGSRWHCFDCDKNSVDFCTDCMIKQLNSPNCHPLTHNLIPLQNDGEYNLELIGASKSYISKPSTSTSTADAIVDKIEEMSSDSDNDNEEDDSIEEQISDDENSSTSASTSTLFYDKDYVSKSFMNKEGKYNYLDPNFLPE